MSNNSRTLAPLLEPQERLDRLIASTFKQRGPRLIDLSYANPADGPSAEVLSILARATAESRGLMLQYTPIAGRTPVRRAVAAKLTQQLSLPFDFLDIVLTGAAARYWKANWQYALFFLFPFFLLFALAAPLAAQDSIAIRATTAPPTRAWKSCGGASTRPASPNRR